ncbi:MAG TPA: DNA polymerase/3'-5' exonuclease PolX [Candidatus Poseidoniaceae archaeon]|nr:DNA polymerase/3'-5' exonuclease PolX [Euryarchaeota archaeon]DAC58258.1 MAG TPA: DNA polymerase/3'-5' exonuclease PolX [Candidatus Poseidoniales archaeon]HII37639.1 DNA polymerase/3'-5' exonuclease PolX [Candidatus Poseidoniaceae archaeon]
MAGGNFSLPKARPSGPPFFSRNQIAAALHQVAVLLELQGANVFRLRSYQNASRTLGGITEDLGELVATGKIFDIKGIGKGLGSAISQAVSQGKWPDDWIDLHNNTPPGLIEMLGIPGLGPKRIKIMNEELGVESITTLKQAALDNSIAGLKGFGAKSQQKMLDGIELLARFRARRRLDVGLMYGEAFEQRIATIDGVIKAQLAGSARRRKETIGDLDIVVGVLDENKTSVSKAILALPGIADVKGAGESKISLILDTSIFEGGFSLGHIDQTVMQAIGGDDYEQLESGGTIDAQVRLVAPEIFPFTLAYFTGSKEHNIIMRQRAIDRGLRLSEFGLIPEAEAGDLKGMAAAHLSLSAIDESEIYRHLDLDWVPPELREDTGEIDAANSAALPRLIVPGDVKGVLHNHTTLSDGDATLEQMAEAARNIGWNWLGVADHSQSLKVANGASPEDLLAQGQQIKQYNATWAEEGIDFRLFHGSESDILEDGKLDYTDEVLAELDYVVASVHAMTKWKNRDEVTNTEDLMRAIDHPATKVLGHPTGRILQGRDGYEIDMFAIIEHMAEHNEAGRLKAVELNASPYRLDLDWRLCKYAKSNNVPVVINPDAHSVRGLGDFAYGVMAARKGWLESGDTLNSLSLDEMTARLL